MSVAEGDIWSRVYQGGGQVIQRYGLHAATLELVASETGVPLELLAAHFRDFAQLAEWMWSSVRGRYFDVVEVLLASPGPLEGRIVALMSTYVEVAGPVLDLGVEMFTLGNGSNQASFHPLHGSSAGSRFAALLELVVDGSTTRVPRGVREELRSLLLVGFSAMTIRAATETAPGRPATQRFIRQGAALVAKSMELAKFPGGGMLLRAAIGKWTDDSSF